MPLEGLRQGFTIAVSGKGGVGKTALSALLVRTLSRLGAVLAIDADPDSNLPQALGLDVETTVGEAREAILNAPARSRVASDKAGAWRQALAERVEETYDYDLVVMGRSEGPGCYCAVNSILREVIDSRAESYDFTVIDCEAGLEHLSRRTTRDVDVLLAVADPTKNGLVTAKRVQELTGELMVDFGTTAVLVNKATPENKPLVEALAREQGVEIAFSLPYDPVVAEYDMLGKPVAQIPDESPVVQAVAALVEQVLTAAAHI
ncbi:MAG: AAA family ATPase [Dehalococcoidia bacterium]|jgi:CO dehydrogenase maturation factor|nr:AAA family ATPase [Dehalococcoidia bacterium]